MNTTMENMRLEGGQNSDLQEVTKKTHQYFTEEKTMPNMEGSNVEGVYQTKKNMPEKDLIKTRSTMFIPQ